MARLIDIHEVEEFCDVVLVSGSDIDPSVAVAIRGLEEVYLEDCIRDILYDPNDTPHGPREVADILTTNIHIHGEKRVAAFALKGQSFKKVTSKIVANQFFKLRTVPHVGLMVLAAVGDIQDDAQTDFFQTAKDANCDFLIIDVNGWARLLTAYGKICVQDGKPFGPEGFCLNGHKREDTLTYSGKKGPVIAAPRIVDLGGPAWGAQAPFTVQNISRYPYFDISVLVVIDTPTLRPNQDIILKMPEPQNKPFEVDIGSATVSTELFLLDGMDPKNRGVFQILINMLAPGQSYTFVLENKSPFGMPKALISVRQFGTKPESIRILNDSRLKALYNEASSLQKQGRHDEALERGRSALAWARQHFGDDSFQVADAENTLGILCAEQHRMVEAAMHFQNALEGIEKAVGPNSKAAGEILKSMERLYYEMGKSEEAKEFSDRGDKILRLFGD